MQDKDEQNPSVFVIHIVSPSFNIKCGDSILKYRKLSVFVTLNKCLDLNEILKRHNCSYRRYWPRSGDPGEGRLHTWRVNDFSIVDANLVFG